MPRGRIGLQWRRRRRHQVLLNRTQKHRTEVCYGCVSILDRRGWPPQERTSSMVQSSDRLTETARLRGAEHPVSHAVNVNVGRRRASATAAALSALAPVVPVACIQPPQSVCCSIDAGTTHMRRERIARDSVSLADVRHASDRCWRLGAGAEGRRAHTRRPHFLPVDATPGNCITIARERCNRAHVVATSRLRLRASATMPIASHATGVQSFPAACGRVHTPSS